MATTDDLLHAVAAKLRLAKDSADQLIFRSVGIELSRLDLEDLVNQSAPTPAARVCFLVGKPVHRHDGGLDIDVSVAIVVAAARVGQALSDISTADKAALKLMLDATSVLMTDPSVGLAAVQPAQFGDHVVAKADKDGKQGVAIALCEVKWRLLEVVQARRSIQRGIETGRFPDEFTGVAINDGEPLEAPIGWTPTTP